MMRNQFSAKQFMHTPLHVHIPYVSIHTYPRGSLIPETCSNGTLGRKQLKDSCEIQELEMRLRKYSKFTTFKKKMEDFRFLIQCNSFKREREGE